MKYLRCPFCQRGCISRRELEAHIEHVHSGVTGRLLQFPDGRPLEETRHED